MKIHPCPWNDNEPMCTQTAFLATVSCFPISLLFFVRSWAGPSGQNSRQSAYVWASEGESERRKCGLYLKRVTEDMFRSLQKETGGHQRWAQRQKVQRSKPCMVSMVQHREGSQKLLSKGKPAARYHREKELIVKTWATPGPRYQGSDTVQEPQFGFVMTLRRGKAAEAVMASRWPDVNKSKGTDDRVWFRPECARKR